MTRCKMIKVWSQREQASERKSVGWRGADLEIAARAEAAARPACYHAIGTMAHALLGQR